MTTDSILAELTSTPGSSVTLIEAAQTLSGNMTDAEMADAYQLAGDLTDHHRNGDVLAMAAAVLLTHYIDGRMKSILDDLGQMGDMDQLDGGMEE